MLHMPIQRKLSSKTTRKKEHSRVKTLPICFALLICWSGKIFLLQNMIKAAVPSFPISNLCFTGLSTFCAVPLLDEVIWVELGRPFFRQLAVCWGLCRPARRLRSRRVPSIIYHLFGGLGSGACRLLHHYWFLLVGRPGCGRLLCLRLFPGGPLHVIGLGLLSLRNLHVDRWGVRTYGFCAASGQEIVLFGRRDFLRGWSRCCRICQVFVHFRGFNRLINFYVNI